VDIQKRIEKRLDHGSKWENASNSAPSDLQQFGNTLDQNSKHTVDFEGHEEPIASKARTRPIFENADIQEKLEKRLEHVSGRENASQSAPNDLQQLGNTLDQNSKHTVDFGGHEEPAGSKARTGPNFENMDIQEKLEKRSEHVSGRENASQGAPNDLQQLKTTPDQNPSYRSEHAQVASPQKQDPQQDSIWKDHSTLKSAEQK
jgi:hypothetical protein